MAAGFKDAIVHDYVRTHPRLRSADGAIRFVEKLYMACNVKAPAKVQYVIGMGKDGKLCLFQMKFKPATAQTESILVPTPPPPLQQWYCCFAHQLRDMFVLDDQEKDIFVRLTSFVATPYLQSQLFSEFKQFIIACSYELAQFPLNKFFLESNKHCKVINKIEGIALTQMLQFAGFSTAKHRKKANQRPKRRSKTSSRL